MCRFSIIFVKTLSDMFDEEFKDEEEQTYADVFFDHDWVLNRIENLIEDATCKFLTNDLYGRINDSAFQFGYSWEGVTFFPIANKTFETVNPRNGEVHRSGLTKAILKQEAKNQNLLVVQRTHHVYVDYIINAFKIGSYCYDTCYYPVLFKTEFRKKLLYEVMHEQLDMHEFDKQQKSILALIHKFTDSIEDKRLIERMHSLLLPQ